MKKAPLLEVAFFKKITAHQMEGAALQTDMQNPMTPTQPPARDSSINSTQEYWKYRNRTTERMCKHHSPNIACSSRAVERGITVCFLVREERKKLCLSLPSVRLPSLPSIQVACLPVSAISQVVCLCHQSGCLSLP